MGDISPVTVPERQGHGRPPRRSEVPFYNLLLRLRRKSTFPKSQRKGDQSLARQTQPWRIQGGNGVDG